MSAVFIPFPALSGVEETFKLGLLSSRPRVHTSDIGIFQQPDSHFAQYTAQAWSSDSEQSTCLDARRSVPGANHLAYEHLLWDNSEVLKA